MGPYVGLYRGVVTATEDPVGRGRVQISVPEIGEDLVAWASLSMPVGGAMAAAPPLGARVWIQFELGNVRYPVVTGLIVG